MSVIGPIVRGKRVLDLGVVDSWREKVDTREQVLRSAGKLFERVVAESASTVGLDIDQEGAELLSAKGFGVRYGDVHTVDLNEKFDVIVAGEIIEHLENPGQFLRNMRRHLVDDGTIIVTTPNPFYAKQSYKIWRKGRPQVHTEHTCWFDPITLGQLMEMTGFKPTVAYWHQPQPDLLKAWKRLFRGYFSYSFLTLATPNLAFSTAPNPAPQSAPHPPSGT